MTTASRKGKDTRSKHAVKEALKPTRGKALAVKIKAAKAEASNGQRRPTLHQICELAQARMQQCCFSTATRYNF